VETYCIDGSCFVKLVPVDEEQAMMLSVLAQVIAELRLPRWPPSMLPNEESLLMSLPPPGRDKTAG